MGKKRSNRNKRKKDSKNVLKNSSEDKRGDSVLDEDVRKGNNSKNTSSSNQELANKNSFPFCNGISTDVCYLRENSSDKTLGKFNYLRTESSRLYSHKNASRNTYVIFPNSHDTESKSNKLCGEICSTSLNQSENKNQDSSSFQKYQAKPVTCHPFRTPGSDLANVFPIRHPFQNICLSERDENNPTLSISRKKSFTDKTMKQTSGFQSFSNELNDKMTLSRYLTDKISESDEEYSTSDLFKPVFDNWNEEKNIYGVCDENSLFTENAFSEANCSSFRNVTQKSASKDDNLKETVSGSVNAYKSSKDYFSDVYHTWVSERRDTLQKLRTLHSEVHNDQLKYNKSQEAFRKLGCVSRSVKNPNNQVADFLASFTAFLGDAASGMVSVAQAFNVDSYQSKFKEIMENDAEHTKCLYVARSRCVANYRDIEEVMRKFHSDNFSSTIGKISDALEVDKYWEGMKNAYKNDDMTEFLQVVSKFFDNALQSTKLEEVSDSIHRYADDNPAAVEACKSAGRATYEALYTWGGNRIKNSVLKDIDMAANHLLILDDRREIERLKNTIEGDSPQSIIESQIEDAIDSLESELSEMKDIYFKLFKYDGES